MSIHKVQRKNARSAYAVRWVDEAGRHRSRRFDRKADAEKWELEVRNRKQTGDLISFDGGRVSLAEFGREWFSSYAKDHLSPETRKAYAGVWDRHILPPLGGHSLRRLYADPQLIHQFATDLAADGTGPEAIKKCLTLLQGVLQRAVEWNRIPDNPVRKIRKPTNKNKRQAIVMAPATVEALRAILVRDDRLGDATLISVLAYAGLRPGEALALRWKHIATKSIVVEGAVSNGRHKDTKTGKVRSVRLLAPLADDLRAWRAASTHDTDDDLIFPRPNGEAWSTEDWKNWTNRVFQRTCLEAGLGRYVKRTVNGNTQCSWRASNGTDAGPRPYDLRHSFVSLLIHEGSSIVEVAANAGHSATMTLNTYGHVIAEFDPTDRRPAHEQIAKARRGDLRVSCPFLPRGEIEPSDGEEKPLPEQGFLCKPSVGFEPTTPSLPWKVHGVGIRSPPAKKLGWLTRSSSSCLAASRTISTSSDPMSSCSRRENSSNASNASSMARMSLLPSRRSYVTMKCVMRSPALSIVPPNSLP